MPKQSTHSYIQETGEYYEGVLNFQSLTPSSLPPKIPSAFPDIQRQLVNFLEPIGKAKDIFKEAQVLANSERLMQFSASSDLVQLSVNTVEVT